MAIPEIDPIDEKGEKIGEEEKTTERVKTTDTDDADLEGSAVDPDNDFSDDLGDDDDIDENEEIYSVKSTTSPITSTTVTNTVASISIPPPENPAINPKCPASEEIFMKSVFYSFHEIKDCPEIQIYSASATFNSIQTQGSSNSMNLQMRAPLKDSGSPEFYIVSGLMKQTVSIKLQIIIPPKCIKICSVNQLLKKMSLFLSCPSIRRRE